MAMLVSTYTTRKLDVRIPGKGNSNVHGSWPVHLITTMIKWIRTGRLSIKNSLSLSLQFPTAFEYNESLLFSQRDWYLKKGIQTPMARGRST